MLRSVLPASEESSAFASPARVRFVRRWRARGSPGQARPGCFCWRRWSAPASRRRRGRFPTRNLANFLRPLAPGKEDDSSPGRLERQLSEGPGTLGSHHLKVRPAGRRHEQRWLGGSRARSRGHPGRLPQGTHSPLTNPVSPTAHHSGGSAHPHSFALASLARPGSGRLPCLPGTAPWRGMAAFGGFSLLPSPATPGKP